MKGWQYNSPWFDYEERGKDWETPWSGHKYFGYDLVQNLKPRTIVELGTAGGTSMFSFAQAVKDAKIDVKICAVDTWEGDNHTGGYSNQVYERVKEISDSVYSEVDIQLMRMFFDKARDTFENQSVDLLHIDGLHTYVAVKNDFQSWLPKVSLNGVIIFHDISEKKDDFGVYRFWEELKEEYGTMEFHHSHGLGVLFLSRQSYDSMKSYETDWNVNYLRTTYQSMKTELYECKKRLRELDEIKASRFYVTKERFKSLLGS
jgi:hypothetical protein